MKILGIDPGFGITGYGVIELGAGQREPVLLEAGVLRTSAQKQLGERLCDIYSSLVQIMNEFSPHGVALENVYSSQAFPKSAIAIGQVQGVVLLAAAQKNIPVGQYFPIEVKKALLGYGHAGKAQVQKMVQRVLNLTTIPKPDDAADAIAVALCHARRAEFLAGAQS